MGGGGGIDIVYRHCICDNVYVHVAVSVVCLENL